MAIDLSGSWRLDSTEANFDAFLKVCGVAWAWRKAATSVKPTVSISQNEAGDFVIITRTTYQTQEMRFTVGEEFRSIIPWEAGEHAMVATWDDDARLVITVKGTDISFTREILEGHLVLTQTKGDMSSRRYFKKSVAEG